MIISELGLSGCNHRVGQEEIQGRDESATDLTSRRTDLE